MFKYLFAFIFPIACFADNNVSSLNVYLDTHQKFIVGEFVWSGHSYFVINKKMIMHSPDCAKCKGLESPFLEKNMIHFVKENTIH